MYVLTFDCDDHYVRGVVGCEEIAFAIWNAANTSGPRAVTVRKVSLPPERTNEEKEEAILIMREYMEKIQENNS